MKKPKDVRSTDFDPDANQQQNDSEQSEESAEPDKKPDWVNDATENTGDEFVMIP